VTTGNAVRQSDFLVPEVLANPYPVYAALRAEPNRSPDNDRATLRLFDYAGVAAVLRDDRFSVARVLPVLDRACLLGLRGKTRERATTALRILHDMLPYTDPPQHTQLRKLVQPFFAPIAVEALRPRIEEIVSALIDAVRPAGGMDLIADLARLLPTTVIAEIIGLSTIDRERLVRWSSDFSGFFGIGRPDPVRSEAALISHEEFADYLTPVLDARRDWPRNDLLSALVAAETRGDLTARELHATCMTLLIGGHETTIGLIGNGLLALLRHPDQLNLLRSNPQLIDSAIDELARFDSPVQLTAFVATEDVTLGERTFRKDAFVECWIGAANRDPAQFPDPGRLDLGRKPNRHLAFGVGSHFCLGAALGRLEAAVAINAVVQAFPRLRLTRDDIDWRPSVVFRSPISLPVEFY
jgi:hypothetical protein